MSAGHGRGWLAAGAIFVLGLAVGAAGMSWWSTRSLQQLVRARAGEPTLAERAAVRLGGELARDLDLSADEAARVQAVLDRTGANLRTLRQQTALRVAAELRATNEQIAAALPEGKRAEFQRVQFRRLERLGLLRPGGKADRK